MNPLVTMVKHYGVEPIYRTGGEDVVPDSMSGHATHLLEEITMQEPGVRKNGRRMPWSTDPSLAREEGDSYIARARNGISCRPAGFSWALSSVG